MAKFSGLIGFVYVQEDPPYSGIYKAKTVERKYHGDMMSRKVRYDASEGTNDDIQLNMELSIVSDGFVKEHLGYIRYAVMNGAKWSVKSVDIRSPRIVLTIGGVYHGAQT